MAGKDWRCKYYNDGGCAEWSLVNNSVYLDQFEVHESGVSTEMPQVGDLMVWRERPPAGHVGIISGIKGNSLLISNSNSNNTSHVFKYILDEDNRITLLSKDGTSFGWIPIWWARKK